MKFSDLLLDQRIVAVRPELVRAFGSVTQAAVFQQIHYHFKNGHVSFLDDEPWVSVSCADLGNQIGLTARQVQRATTQLEAAGALASCQPEGYERRKWYRILGDAEISLSSNDANASIEGRKRVNPMTQTRPSSSKRIRPAPQGSADTSAAPLEGLFLLEDQEPRVRADDLVAHYVTRYELTHGGHTPLRAFRAAAGRAAKAALKEGVDPEHIKACFNAIAKQGKNPTVLPHVLSDYHYEPQEGQA